MPRAHRAWPHQPAFRSAFGTNVGIGSQALVMFRHGRAEGEWLPA